MNSMGYTNLLPKSIVRKRRLNHMARVEARLGRLYISPWLIGFIIFIFGPMVLSLYYSFTEFSFTLAPEWIGIENYTWAFTSDRLFYISLSNTIYYIVVSVPLGLSISLILALLLNRSFGGRALWRTIYYLPSIVPTVASTFLFMFIFQANYGFVNSWLWKLFGIEGPGWFTTRAWVKPTLIILSLWGAGGTRMIIFLAGLQNIPAELYEAAEVDGAGRLVQFTSITIPMLSPTIFFNLVTGIISAFKIFGPAYIATGGGPYYGSYFYVLHLFNNAFRLWRAGYASALAWLLFIIILILTFLQFGLARRWVYYESASIAA